MESLTFKSQTDNIPVQRFVTYCSEGNNKIFTARKEICPLHIRLKNVLISVTYERNENVENVEKFN